MNINSNVIELDDEHGVRRAFRGRIIGETRHRSTVYVADDGRVIVADRRDRLDVLITKDDIGELLSALVIDGDGEIAAHVIRELDLDVVVPL